MTGFQKAMRMSVAAGGLAALVGGNAQAAAIAVADQGFEDHVIDDASGYAYGAAGQAGDADGWNNASSAGGGISPWQSLNENGNGIDGGAGSFMYVASYATGGQADPIGNQAMEAQSTVAQVVGATYQVDTVYTLTVAAAPSGETNLNLYFFDGTAVDLSTAVQGDVFANATANGGVGNLVSAAPAGGVMEDLSFSITILAGNALIGQEIGIGFGTVSGAGTGVDNVRLDASPVPEPGSLALLGLGGLAMLRRRR